MLKSGPELTPAGFEDSALGIGESGEVRGCELVQHAIDVIEARGDLGGAAAQRGGALLGASRLGAPGIAQQRLACGTICAAIRGQERVHLACGERVALDGAGKAGLFPGPERAQGDGPRERQAAAIDARAQVLRQAPAERQAALHPLRLATQEFGDRGRREAVLARERRHDASLVHWAGGLRQGVRVQEPSLHRWTRDGLDDDGDLEEAFSPPPGESLEAVEDLVGAVVRGGDADWHERQFASVRAFAAQGSEGRAKAFDRDVDHVAGSSSGINWKSGYR